MHARTSGDGSPASAGAAACSLCEAVPVRGVPTAPASDTATMPRVDGPRAIADDEPRPDESGGRVRPKLGVVAIASAVPPIGAGSADGVAVSATAPTCCGCDRRGCDGTAGGAPNPLPAPFESADVEPTTSQPPRPQPGSERMTRSAGSGA